MSTVNFSCFHSEEGAANYSGTSAFRRNAKPKVLGLELSTARKGQFQLKNWLAVEQHRV